MGYLYQGFQVIAASKVGVDLQKVLDAIAMIGILKLDLLKDRAYPDCRDTQTLQVTNLAGQAFEIPTDIASTCLPPLAAAASF